MLLFEIMCLLMLACMVLFGFLQKKLAYRARSNTTLLRIPRLLPMIFAGLMFANYMLYALVAALSQEALAYWIPVLTVIDSVIFVMYLWSEWHSLAWRLEYSESEDFFDCRDFFFRKKRLKYSDFQFYKFAFWGLVLKNGQHHIIVDDLLIRSSNFVDVLNSHHIYQDKKY